MPLLCWDSHRRQGSVLEHDYQVLTKDGLHAGKVVQKAAQVCGGGGGGRPDMAQAGGRLPEKLSEALDEAKEVLIAQIKGM